MKHINYKIDIVQKDKKSKLQIVPTQIKEKIHTLLIKNNKVSDSSSLQKDLADQFSNSWIS